MWLNPCFPRCPTDLEPVLARRYKRLFSELHYLAASLLAGTGRDELRARYQRDLSAMRYLWSEHAIELLRRLTRESVVVLVTGSEQTQTEECVRLFAGQNVVLERILVRGSLYGFDVARKCYTGSVEAQNVTQVVQAAIYVLLADHRELGEPEPT